ncbi:MAG TPA: PIN domain-containing protein [Phycisphaerae bacterium]|nr:PIN domain-containing protein [Phycisphaerae bacterium]
MSRKRKRIYVDTSVIGGCHDAEFAADSRGLMDLALRGRIILLLSTVVLAELEEAPAQVSAEITRIPASAIEEVPITDDIVALRDAYVAAGVVSAKWLDDATHVAAASVARADAIVSWNFKHIVRLDRIRGYNGVNRKLGYPDLVIVTPTVVTHEQTGE